MQAACHPVRQKFAPKCALPGHPTTNDLGAMGAMCLSRSTARCIGRSDPAPFCSEPPRSYASLCCSASPIYLSPTGDPVWVLGDRGRCCAWLCMAIAGQHYRPRPAARTAGLAPDHYEVDAQRRAVAVGGYVAVFRTSGVVRARSSRISGAAWDQADVCPRDQHGVGDGGNRVGRTYRLSLGGSAWALTRWAPWWCGQRSRSAAI